MSKKAQNARLEEAYVAITNARTIPELRDVLSRYNYGEAQLNEGLARYTAVQQLTQQREQATQTARETTGLYQASRERLIDLFQVHRDTARLAYKREVKYTDQPQTHPAPQRCHEGYTGAG